MKNIYLKFINFLRQRKTFVMVFLCFIVALALALFIIKRPMILTSTDYISDGYNLIKIEENTKYSLEFKNDKNILTSFAFKIKVSKIKNENALINLKIYDGNNELEKKIIKLNELKLDDDKGSYVTVVLDKELKNPKKLRVDMELRNSSDSKISFYLTSLENDNVSLTRNDKNLGSLFVVVSGLNPNYSYLVIILLLLVILYAVTLKYYYNNINKDKKNRINSIISSKKIILLQFILSIIFALSSYFCILYYNFYGNNYIIYFIISLISGFTIYTIILLILFMKNYSLEKLFLIIAIPLGLLYITFLIPGRIADEPLHFYRAYDISNGNIIESKSGNLVPKDMLKNINKYTDSYIKWHSIIQKNKDISRTSKDYKRKTSNADAYNPINYTFSSLGFASAKVFNINSYYGFYLGRLFNFLFYLVIGYLIIKIIPFGKLTSLIYLLNPMALHQVVAISADAFIIPICLLFISYVLYLYYKEKIDKKDILLLSILMLFVMFGKKVYIVLFLLLLILYKKFKSLSKKDKAFVIAMIMISLIIGFCWIYRGRIFPTTTKDTSNAIIPIKQSLVYIKANPLNAITVFANNLYTNAFDYIITFAGASMGWLDIRTNLVLVSLYLIILMLCSFAESGNQKVESLLGKYMIFIFIMVSILMIMGIYVSWPQSNLLSVTGVQGRYFIPYALLLSLGFISFDIKLNIKNYKFKFIMITLLVNTACLFAIISYCL